MVKKEIITVEVLVNAPVEKVWEYWTSPNHITKWNFASDEWCCPHAKNDLKVKGKFNVRMEAKDKSVGFDFEGVYTLVENFHKISYKMPDNREVKIEFLKQENKTKVIETFDAETENSLEMQKEGWQSILNNFKKYVEENPLVTVHFEKEINAPAKKVFETMLSKKNYEQWTKTFNPTSTFEGSWEKGSKILFVGVDEKGNKGGMVSMIKENIPNKFLSILHQGILEGDKEILSGPKVEGWRGATENYTFSEKNGKTTLIVDTDTIKEYEEYFKETWPKALDVLKRICEEKK